MKVVINRCYGGFGLSDEAIEECIKRGMSVADEGSVESFLDIWFIRMKKKDRISGHRYCSKNEYSPEFRSHPIVVAVVEEMGDRANDQSAKLSIIGIPFDSCEGWEITDYDGMESVEETHQSWS